MHEKELGVMLTMELKNKKNTNLKVKLLAASGSVSVSPLRRPVISERL